MIGLENVKEEFLDIKAKIEVAIRQNIDMKNERLGAALLGNPGTGKTTVARLYAKFLSSVGALPGGHFVETSGSRLANDGVTGCQKLIDQVLNSGGGALFIDEAYQLASGNSPMGKQVLDFLLAEVENLTGKVVFILAGYNKQMEAFFAHNPGIPSRFPRGIQFRDYENEELLEILSYGLNKRYHGQIKTELGFRGLYCRIVARRIGRGRDREGFGNARAVENTIARITDRQAKRLRRERRGGKRPDDLLLTQEDLLGPEPKDALKDNPSWVKLQELIGLSSVKDSVKALFDTIQYNYTRELDEEPLIDFSLNKVFLGNPGTGKTTVAKLYGLILADMGFLSSGEVAIRTPADFIADIIGGSEAKTKGILAATLGKVLVIDEAYSLYDHSGRGSNTNTFKTSVIDTIVAEVQSVPGDDRCVLLLGYKEKMEEMFQNVNPGLTRRFPLDSAFTFEDFIDTELESIFDLKLKQIGFKTTKEAKKVALGMISRSRNRLHFGNAGEIDILFNAAKLRHQQRISKGKQKISAIFEAPDFDPDFDRGCEEIVTQLQGYQNMVANMKELGEDPYEQLPFTFLFRGPPGTGKTSTARKMGKVYYDMGFLASAEVVECSATDLVGEYIGHTGPKTQKLLEKALGKILFIDEAYRLADSRFSNEAMDEIVDCVTKPKFANKMIIILAGYDADINRLMSTNPGLTSRFPESMNFRALTSQECSDLLGQLLTGKKNLDAAVLNPPSPAFRARLVGLLDALAALPSWANARDVKTLVKSIFGRIMRAGKPSRRPRTVSEACVVEELEKMLQERARRASAAGQRTTRPASSCATPQASSNAPSQPPVNAGGSGGAQSVKEKDKVDDKDKNKPAEEETKGPDARPRQENGADEGDEQRDAGVSDEVWEQLQRDKLAVDAAEREYERLAAREKEIKKEIKTAEDDDKNRSEDAPKDEAEGMDGQPQEDTNSDEQCKEEHERNRMQKILEQRRRDEEEARRREELERKRKELADIERRRKKMEEEKRKEAKKQACLKRMGVCPVGYRWIKQSSGYRCAGGSHWVSGADISRWMG
ncbi:NFX1-type zinc finger-containing protein 1 [Neofusicoccum parvum]|uniref:NFX1-type zinc finger-containing protein 1 n=1 Tax=Neofusicoccum parvum TaxID=310453 RepID=A0ACB5SBZ9_9PEZI|nr:NFX1-type zinc finger-containing protein 1 [Neofusicoccum parvum]